MKSAAIYPITKDNQYLLQNKAFPFRNVFVKAAVVPNAFRKVVSLPNVQVFHHLEDVFNQVETVIFLLSHDRKKLLLEMEKVLSKKMEVIAAFELSGEETEQLNQCAAKNDTQFQCLIENRLMKLLHDREDPFQQPESALIAVSAITKGIPSSEIVLNLAKSLKEMGYYIGVICTDPDMQVLDGVAYLPLDQLIGSNLDRCVMKINLFLNLYQTMQKPDIIIIQLPDEGICRLNDEMASSFGTRTYIISQAVEFDYGIVLSPVMSMDAGFYTWLSNIFINRFGLEINSVCIVAKEAKMEMAHGAENLQYYVLPKAEAALNADALNEQEEEIHFYHTSEKYADGLAAEIVEYLS